jgi:RNA polymerase sigma factor (sigma-70 family)
LTVTTEVTNTELPSQELDDSATLRTFAVSRQEDAFQALVQKYLGMVFGIALRRTGDHCLAEEISQNVFSILARKAARLPGAPTLAGWLHRTTVLECSEAMRHEYAHQRKLDALSNHVLTAADGDSVWREAVPLLDEAIASLPPADRDLILQRFYERKSFRKIGAALSKTDDAAQKQCERALQKLAHILARKGVLVPAGALAAGLTAHVAQAAPSGLAWAISKGTLAGVSTLSAKTIILKTLRLMTHTKSRAVLTVALVAAIPLMVLWQQNHDLLRQLAQLNTQSDAGPPTTADTGAVESTPSDPAGTPAIQPGPAQGQSLTQAEVAAAWEKALMEPDPIRRARLLSELLASLRAEQAPAVAQVFDQLHGFGRAFTEEYHLFLRAWGKLDGAAALAHVVKEKASPEDIAHVNAALAGWASVDSTGALGWVEALPDNGQKEDIIFGLLDGWSMVDFASAAAYAESRPRSEARDRFRQLLLERSLAAGGIAAAQAWCERIPDDEHNQLYKQRAFDEVIKTILYRDPSAAARWITQLSGQSYLSPAAVQVTAGKLAEASPSQTLQWLQSLTGADQKQISSSFGKVVEVWAKQDPSAVGTWLAQNADQPQYDAMAAQYAQVIANTDPQTALSWARTLSDTDARQQSLLQIAGTYLRSDPQNAVPALQAAGFSQDILDQAIEQAKAGQNLTQVRLERLYEERMLAVQVQLDMATAELQTAKAQEELARMQYERAKLTQSLSASVAPDGLGDPSQPQGSRGAVLLDYGADGNSDRALADFLLRDPATGKLAAVPDSAYTSTFGSPAKNPHGAEFQGQSCASCHNPAQTTK